MTQIILTTALGTGLQTFNVPSDWSNTNTIEVIGAGSDGSAASGSGGGAGAAYSKIVNSAAFSPGGTSPYQVGQRGTTGQDSWLGGTTLGASAVGAKGGGAAAGPTGGSGGAAGSGVGTTKTSGGNGGGGNSGLGGSDSGGGGGAGGAANGNAGGAGSGAVGGGGGRGDGAAGGTGGAGAQSGVPAFNGNPGTELGTGAVAGAGGGGGGNSAGLGAGNGGNYGAGGGGGGGLGVDGVIIINYTPAAVTPFTGIPWYKAWEAPSRKKDLDVSRHPQATMVFPNQSVGVSGIAWFKPWEPPRFPTGLRTDLHKFESLQLNLLAFPTLVSGIAWMRAFEPPFFPMRFKTELAQTQAFVFNPQFAPSPVSGMSWWYPFDQPRQVKTPAQIQQTEMFANIAIPTIVPKGSWYKAWEPPYYPKQYPWWLHKFDMYSFSAAYLPPQPGRSPYSQGYIIGLQ